MKHMSETIFNVPIAEIIIGTRFRKELGDITALSESITQNGLLQPIGISAENRLIFGYRRVEAYKTLALTHIPARRIDIVAITEGQWAENEMRVPFTDGERMAILDMLSPKLKAEARARQLAALK